MNDDVIDEIATYLTASGIDYDIVSQVKAMLVYPTPNVVEEVITFFKEQHVDKTIALVVWDMLVTHIERGNYYV